MIARLSASLRFGQAAISCSVLPHPTQRPVRPSTAQIFWQGLDGASIVESYALATMHQNIDKR